MYIHPLVLDAAAPALQGFHRSRSDCMCAVCVGLMRGGRRACFPWRAGGLR
ncbi:predicted protein [Plenodomus lingam JN3]|uniref:Predicted protein n=1 Tax=Leptosphaeria maculans (strain JN3 / isolate v23.1.3 / race Av1-4-5-6-7-8) TaxID=985895 RepID=E5A085_LEPMJ|nr:predicted protein [Plenodomus lingam JN3]CBX96945.1 predicted protein [Plenodomus lingam JN3]